MKFERTTCKKYLEMIIDDYIHINTIHKNIRPKYTPISLFKR